MGRAGRVAPRICSTLELRTHASSLTVSLAPTAAAASTKPVPASPPSPGTPVQVVPASVRPVLQAWPRDALQVVQRQMEALRSQSSFVEPVSSRKRELESSDSESEVNENRQGFEVALQTQPALPEDWEQFLNLKTGQFYYFHWSSCKRAKQNPRELVRRADEAVQAHLREAHIRGESAVEHIDLDALMPHDDESEEESEAGCEAAGSWCPADDVCERTRGMCSSDRTELSNDGSMTTCGSFDSEEDQGVATNIACESEGKSAQQTFMVVSGCHSCSMFVMLCLSSPACPSCGAGARSNDHNGIP